MSKNTASSDGVPDKAAPAPARKKKKLGKGLEALLGQARGEEPLIASASRDNHAGSDHRRGGSAASGNTGLASISVSAIEPLPGQPRRHFDDHALDELAASISARGVIQPVIVRALKKGRYQLVAGERRWRAAQRARLHEIPALVRELDEAEVMALALIENIQREDLNPVEEAMAYQRLADNDGMKQAEIARLVDKSRSHVANLQRLLVLPQAVLDLVVSEALSMGHARALIGHDDAEKLAQQAIDDNLSVRDVERLVRKSAQGGQTTGARRRARNSGDGTGDADIAAVQSHLEEFLGLSVRIKSDADPRSGAVTIRYRTLDQLDLICQRLTGGDI